MFGCKVMGFMSVIVLSMFYVFISVLVVFFFGSVACFARVLYKLVLVFCFRAPPFLMMYIFEGWGLNKS